MNSKRRFVEAAIVSAMLCLAMPIYTYAASNRIPYNNQDLFLNGANLAWQYFANDIGPATYSPDMTHFDSVFSQFEANGGNVMRLWLHTNGAVTPAWSGFTVTGPGTNTIADLQTILDDAWSHKVSVMLCLWSFDMLREEYDDTINDRAEAILTDPTYRQTYIDNCLIPMVTALAGHPAIVAWEIFNEPEGMTSVANWNFTRHVPMANIQAFVNKCAGAIHRTDPSVLVTNGCWDMRAGTDVDGHYNYYTDARLIAAGGDADGTLDFYCIHYYDWAGTAHSPFLHPASYWGLDKPLVIAEFFPNCASTYCTSTPYESLYQNGYAGALGWSWTDVAPALLLAQMNAIWTAHPADVEIIINPDTDPPVVPTGLSATGGESSVVLDWDDNIEFDLAGYNVYRSLTSGSGYVKLNSSYLTSSDYIDVNVVSVGVTYYYVVTALDTSNNESDSSNEASAAPYDTMPPSAPMGFSAIASNGKVTLNWNNNPEGDINGYSVYRSLTSGSGYAKLNGSLLSSPDYIDFSVVNETIYYYVVTAVDTSSNESGYSSQTSAMPSAIAPTIYHFAGINTANTNYNAYACDVDVFPFAGSSGNRSTMPEATDAEYISISANDTSEWATVNPLSSDETFLWIEMKIIEPPSNITKIDLTFNGYTSGPSGVTHRIYVMTADADWTLNASWTQVGTDQSISPGVYATMTRSITSDISNYINASGRIVWGVYETTSAQVTHINYLEMAVTETTPNNPPTVSITSPLDGDVFAQGSNITINANASDTDGTVTKVEFFQGTTKLGEDTSSPYSYTWNSVPTGLYNLTAKATDDGGNSTTSSPPVGITVLGAVGTGAVKCEWWTGIQGTAVGDLTSDVNYPDNSTGRELLVTLEGPINWADNYGTRIRGYLNPVTSGDYTFWITSDASSELWLSTDAEPANKTLIASVDGSGTQQSSLIPFVSGNKYYIEVLHKEGTGNDNIAVAWQGPGISQQIIDGIYLSPCCLEFEDFAGFASQWNQTGCNAGNDWCAGADFNRSGLVTIDDLNAFVEGWLLGAD